MTSILATTGRIQPQCVSKYSFSSSFSSLSSVVGIRTWVVHNPPSPSLRFVSHCDDFVRRSVSSYALSSSTMSSSSFLSSVSFSPYFRQRNVGIVSSKYTVHLPSLASSSVSPSTTTTVSPILIPNRSVSSSLSQCKHSISYSLPKSVFPLISFRKLGIYVPINQNIFFPSFTNVSTRKYSNISSSSVATVIRHPYCVPSHFVIKPSSIFPSPFRLLSTATQTRKIVQFSSTSTNFSSSSTSTEPPFSSQSSTDRSPTYSEPKNTVDLPSSLSNTSMSTIPSSSSSLSTPSTTPISTNTTITRGTNGDNAPSSSPPYIPDRYLTVPNIMTMIRMLLAPHVGYCILSNDYQFAFYTALVAGILDGLDGWVARKWTNQASVIGSYLDPLADKLLIITATITLGYQYILSPYLVTLIIGRDILLIIGGLVLRYKTKPSNVSFFSTSHVSTLAVEPTTLSKYNTLLQIILICVSITSAAWEFPGPTDNNNWFLWGLSWCVAGTTFFSGLGYWNKHGYKKAISVPSHNSSSNNNSGSSKVL